MKFNFGLLLLFNLIILCYSKPNIRDIIKKTLKINKKPISILSAPEAGEQCLFKCSDEIAKDGHCLHMVSSEDISVYNCDKSGKKKKYCYDSSDETLDVLCAPLKSFYHESCSDNSTCYTGFCKDGKCEYKDDGEKCNADKECGLESYCINDKCIHYRFEGEKCSSEFMTTSYCSPQFYCNSLNKCQLKGTKKDGEAGVTFQCESFYSKDGICTSECDNVTDVYCIIAQNEARIFKELKWEEEKLSDLIGVNAFGDLDTFNTIFEVGEELLDIAGCDEDQMKCNKNWIREFSAASIPVTHSDQYEPGFTLRDADIKKVLGVKNSSFRFKISLAILAFIGLLLL